MLKVKPTTWKKFRDSIHTYAEGPREWREQVLFRGHSSVHWKMETTLDRHRKFKGDRERSQYYDGLLGEFRRQVVDLGVSSKVLPEGNSEAFELLARHHGLPSPLLDWTQSPYIASYFAFAGVPETRSDSVAIWVFERNGFDFELYREKIRLIDDYELLRFNKRALRQRSLFMHVLSVSEVLEDILSTALSKFVLPSGERTLALSDLDEMMINATTLFPDLDGAAKTAAIRLSLREGVADV